MQTHGVDHTRPSAERAEELIRALETLPDRHAAALARELVQSVLSLHRSALARVLEMIAEDPAAARLTDSLLQDESFNAVLLLHGLHPTELSERIRRALDRLHPHLGVQGVAVEDVQFSDDGVRIRLGPCDAGNYRDGSADVIRREIERAIFDAAPDVVSLQVEGLPARTVVVPVSSITVRRQATSESAAAHG